MSRNVPDDWNTYYYPCGCHASEGGCSCEGGQIDNSERPWLKDSGYDLEDGSWTKLVTVKRHTCRRAHKDGRISVGQIYSYNTYRVIEDKTGKSRFYHQKQIIRSKK